MSLFPADASQIWRQMPRFRKSQYRGRNGGAALWFVSQEAVGEKRRDGRLGWPDFHCTVLTSHGRKGQRRKMRAILCGLFLCSAFALSNARAAEPSEETIERGKALAVAG